MRDDDGKDGVRLLSEKDNLRNKKLGQDEYAYAMARTAVAQICEKKGFQNFQRFALDVLADVGIRYISEIGKTACFHCSMANRTQCNVFDVLRALEDLGSVQGFSGASHVHHSFSGSGVVRDIFRYVVVSEETPFAHLIPTLPVVKQRTLGPNSVQVDENSTDGHIPSWLPKFPDIETYSMLSSWKARDLKTMGAYNIQVIDEQHKSAKKPLLKLQQKLIHGGYDQVAFELEDAAKMQGAAVSNPFLASPLLFGGNEESLPVLPPRFLNDDVEYHRNCEVTENHVLILDPSFKDNGMGSDTSEADRKIFMNGKPGVQFKISNGNKKFSMAVNPQNAGIEKLSFWFDVDHDRNDRKRKAGKILFTNTGHPMNGTHL